MEIPNKVIKDAVENCQMSKMFIRSPKHEHGAMILVIPMHKSELPPEDQFPNIIVPNKKLVERQ